MIPRALLVTAFLTTPAVATEPADPKPFVGNWAIDFQNPKYRRTFGDASCTRPMTITATDESNIRLSKGNDKFAEYEIRSFDGKFPWWPVAKNGHIFVAEWLDEDNFLLAGKDNSGIKTDWERAKQWKRCDG